MFGEQSTHPLERLHAVVRSSSTPVAHTRTTYDLNRGCSGGVYHPASLRTVFHSQHMICHHGLAKRKLPFGNGVRKQVHGGGRNVLRCSLAKADPNRERIRIRIRDPFPSTCTPVLTVDEFGYRLHMKIQGITG